MERAEFMCYKRINYAFNKKLEKNKKKYLVKKNNKIMYPKKIQIFFLKLKKKKSSP